VNFYDVRGVLVRRRISARQKGLSFEVWNGEDWGPYSQVDAVLRYGLRLTEPQAMALLHGTRNGIETLPRLSEAEARTVLRKRRKIE
jgi:hypothetical protein